MKKTTNIDNEPVYVMTYAELADVMQRLQMGDELWYRDYAPDRPEEGTLYKRIKRLMVDEQDVFLISQCMVSGFVICATMILYEDINGSAFYPFAEQVSNALELMGEWKKPTNMIAVDDCDILDNQGV